MDSELEQFKSHIDLRAYAAGQGYELDRRDSWRGSSVMRHQNGDKIIVKRSDDGHYIYFSVRDDNDNGTIIDFCQHRGGGSLGAVRKELRPWIGGGHSSPLPTFPALPKTGKDRIKVESDYLRMQAAPHHPYLENERCIPAGLLERDRFNGRIRIDARGNAIFPHFDGQGLCGFEIKNTGFTGFAAGGSKGLWFSRTQPDDHRLVLCEGAIDALSFAALASFPDDKTRYASIGGKPNPIQPELIKSAIARMALGSEIVSAMDADVDGAKLAGVVRRAFDAAGRDDLRFTLQEPFGFKDWNDELRARPKHSFPTARPEVPSVA